MSTRQNPPLTRIQREKRKIILDAALDIFSTHGFRGSTIDQIADAANMSKPNLLYYFKTKEAIFETLINGLLDTWLEPLKNLSQEGNPRQELLGYIRRKFEMTRDFPRESRLFANEIIQGAPHIMPTLKEKLKPLVDEKAAIINSWMDEGTLRRLDPYHLIFSIWSTTQHYADFDAQIRAVLGTEDNDDTHLDAASTFLETLFMKSLHPEELSA